MAEHVNRSMQKSVKEFEELANAKLYTQFALRTIIKKHDQFETIIRRRGRSEKDFFEYIDYKQKLMRLTSEKIMNNTIPTIQHLDVLNTMRTHIKRLCSTCTALFPHSYEAWRIYIDFLKSQHMDSQILHTYNSMLKYHSSPDLYIEAAEFARQTCWKLRRARKYLMEGIHLFPEFPELYMALFKLECARAESKWADYKDGDDTDNDPVLGGLVAEGVFREVLEKFPHDLDLLFKFFSFAEKECDILQTLPITLYKEIKNNNLQVKEMWNRIANLQLMGIDCEYDDNQIIRTADWELRARKCLNVYQEGFKIMSDAEDVRTWYITELFNLFLKEFYSECIEQHCVEIMETPSMVEILQAGHYITLVNIFEKKNRDDEAYGMLRKGLDLFPNDMELWIRQVKYYKSHIGKSDILKMIQTSSSKLDEEAQNQFWKSILLTLDDCSSSEVDMVLKEFVKLKLTQYPSLKRLFLDWSFRNCGLSKTREIFNVLINTSSPDLDSYLQMISFEKLEPELSRIQKYYEEACDRFGSRSADVWLDYIAFMKYSNEPNLISALYWRATHKLSPDLLDIFNTLFSEWKANQNY